MRAAAFGLLLSASATAFAADSSAPAEVTCPQPFKATFAVEWHGMGAGTSILELTRQSANRRRCMRRPARLRLLCTCSRVIDWSRGRRP